MKGSKVLTNYRYKKKSGGKVMYSMKTIVNNMIAYLKVAKSSHDKKRFLKIF